MGGLRDDVGGVQDKRKQTKHVSPNLGNVCPK